MPKFNVDQKTIKDLLQSRQADFLIPDYQRPYEWGEKECQTLWDDVFNFAFPDSDKDKFDSSTEYFLGPIVTFKNESGKMEVIDGQQRLTTLMLLLRAFYGRFDKMQDAESVATRENIEKCIWKTNEFGKPIMSALKIDSKVATDNVKEEFLAILRTGEVNKDQKSAYANNYRFFQASIDGFMKDYGGYLAYLPTRLMNNCILLPIEAESRDAALRIFSTLNDRGKPLSDSDIFKSEFYKFYSKNGHIKMFNQRWTDLDELCGKIFHPISGTPMDELFTRYMYYLRATMGNKSTTTEALRKFYEKNNYKLLKNEETFENLVELAHFWNDVSNQDNTRFSNRVLRRLFVLQYAPNGMWTYIVSVYFMQNKDKDGLLEDGAFYDFLQKITAFIWTKSVISPGLNALRTPIFAEMVKITEGLPVDFADNRFELYNVETMFSNYVFSNARPITRSMVAWWAFQDEEQELMPLETVLEIEHIYPRNRLNKEYTLKDEKNLHSLGNKVLLEKRINIRATDYKFEDKRKYYLGLARRGVKKEGTKIHELVEMANNMSDFTEADIMDREKRIIAAFIDYLKENDLLK